MRRSFDSDDRSAKEIKGLFGIAEEDLNIIAGLKPLMMGNMEELLKKWYGWAEKIPEYEEFFPNKDILERVQRQQLKYWDVFFSGLIDEEYLSLRRRLGETHARVGLPLDTYFAGADYFLSLFIDLLDQQKMTLKEYKSTRRALNKLVHLDMTIIVQSYEHLVNEGIAAQSKSLLEMSTPVTQIWNGILLLPVVGLIDSKRAQDIMNSTLAKISESQV
jgi:rsbT co-antagonist protein RsbR